MNFVSAVRDYSNEPRNNHGVFVTCIATGKRNKTMSFYLSAELCREMGMENKEGNKYAFELLYSREAQGYMLKRVDITSTNAVVFKIHAGSGLRGAFKMATGFPIPVGGCVKAWRVTQTPQEGTIFINTVGWETWVGATPVKGTPVKVTTTGVIIRRNRIPDDTNVGTTFALRTNGSY